MTIGNNIKIHRKKSGFTQVQLSEKANISRSYLADIENDRYNPSLETLKSIAIALNVKLNDIVEDDSSNTEIELNSRDKRDIEKQFNKTMESLEQQDGLMFSGEPVTEEDWELIKAAIMNGLELAKKINKQKYTPKKYRK